MDRQSADRQTDKEIQKVFRSVPSGSAIRSDSSISAFLKIKETFPIEPTDGKSAIRHPYDFLHCPTFVIDKTQGGDRNRKVEASIGKGERSGLSPDPVNRVRTSVTGIGKPFKIWIEAGDVEPTPRKTARKPSGPASYIQKRIARPEIERAGNKTIFRFPDPMSSRGFIPSVIGSGLHQEVAR
jgi:hypothetical protein